MNDVNKSLSDKLGIKKDMHILVQGCPYNYRELCSLPENQVISELSDDSFSFIHLFCPHFSELKIHLPWLKTKMTNNGFFWVSWLKKSAPGYVDLDKELIRSFAIENGLVDVKVCTINEHWSAIKLVIPVKDRKK